MLSRETRAVEVIEQAKERIAVKRRWVGPATLLILIGFIYLAVYQQPYPQPGSIDDPGAKFSSGRAMNDLRVLAKAPRPTGTRENEEAASYIRQRLSAFGLESNVQQTISTYPRGNGYVAVRVRNIIARKPGYASTRPVLLMAHYDTAINSPGAGDDGTAVACLLETLRALQSSPPSRNDIIFLFTDGEELGLAGARAFVADHPWSKDIGVALNFEARGASGPSVLFETINGDGWLIDQFAEVAPHAYGSSLLPAVYRKLPHDTDLSVFKRTGVPGLNFAFAEKWSRYHTRLDSLESIDERSVQHHGENALELTRRLASLDLSDPPGEDSVFFNLIGGVIIHYPYSWGIALTLMGALCFVAATVLGFRKRRLSVSGLLLGAAILPVACVVSAILGWLCLDLAGRFSRQPAAFYESGFYYVGAVCLALAAATLFYSWLSRKTSFEDLHHGALLCWLALTITTTILLPGATYLFLWPLLLGVLFNSVMFSATTLTEDGARRAAAVWLYAFPIILLIIPMIYLLFVALAGPQAFAISILVALGAGLLLPAYRLMAGSRWLPPIALALSAGAFLALAIVNAKQGVAYPKSNNIFYMANLDRGAAIWATLAGREDEWTSQFFGGKGSVTELSTFTPDLLYPGARILQGAAPPIQLAPPALSVLEDDLTEGGLRRLKLLITSPGQNPEVSLFIESEAKIVAAEFDGTSLPGSLAGAAGFNDGADGAKQSGPQMSLRCYGIPTKGATLALKTRADAGVKVHVFERSYTLPSVPAMEIRPRGEGVTESKQGDGTITYRSFMF